MRDGDLSGANGGVSEEGDKVSETVNGATEEVEAGAKVGHGGRSEGFDRGEYRFGFGFRYVGVSGIQNREVAVVVAT